MEGKRLMLAIPRNGAGSLGSQVADFLAGFLIPPRASFVYRVRAEPKPVSSVVLTVQDMVRSLRDNGLPISAIAEIAKVERKTVYSWLDGTDVRETNAVRVETLFRSLDAAAIDYRSLYRVWNRRLSHGSSIKDFLCAECLSERAISDAMNELSPAIKRHSERDGVRRSSPTASNPAIDEMPVAVVEP
jgi:hypothetical protein